MSDHFLTVRRRSRPQPNPYLLLQARGAGAQPEQTVMLATTYDILMARMPEPPRGWRWGVHEAHSSHGAAPRGRAFR
jgi:hypothetical protein